MRPQYRVTSEAIELTRGPRRLQVFEQSLAERTFKSVDQSGAGALRIRASLETLAEGIGELRRKAAARKGEGARKEF